MNPDKKKEFLTSPNPSSPINMSNPNTDFSQLYNWMEIDLDVIRKNYLVFQKHVAPAVCSAVLKADAYGMGAQEIGKILFHAGCRHFFVAYQDEAEKLSKALQDRFGASPTYHLTKQNQTDSYKLYILDGPFFDSWCQEVYAKKFTPVLNTIAHVVAWNAFAKIKQERLPAILFIDTGLRRLGLPWEEFSDIQRLNPDSLQWDFFMSHLAASGSKDHIANALQSEKVKILTSSYPSIPFSLADTDGVSLGKEFHHQLVRIGMGLHGAKPYLPGIENAVKVFTRVLQIQTVPNGNGIGYDWTFEAPSTLKMATLSCGYSDGLKYSKKSGLPNFLIHDQEAPVVGKVSMDLTTVDVSHIPDVKVGDIATAFGHPAQAKAWEHNKEKTPYQFLTGLTPRVKRIYKNSI